MQLINMDKAGSAPRRSVHAGVPGLDAQPETLLTRQGSQLIGAVSERRPEAVAWQQGEQQRVRAASRHLQERL